MNNNKRQFSRCSILSPSTGTHLIVNGKRFPCEMVQLSIGGSAIISAKKIPDPRSGFAFLATEGVESVVRITHQESQDKGFLVGLEILEEIPKQHVSPWMTVAWFGIFGTVAAAVCYAVLNLQSNPL